MAALDGEITISFERRPCFVKDKKFPIINPPKKAFWHMFFVDADNEPCALVEYEDGTTEKVYSSQMRFVDNGGFDDVAWPNSAEREEHG